MAKILVTMPEDFLSKVDVIAFNEQRTRSELIREALRGYMRRSGFKSSQKAENEAKKLESLIG